MILDKKLNGILSQEDRALKIFEPSESDKVYDVSTLTLAGLRCAYRNFWLKVQF